MLQTRRTNWKILILACSRLLNFQIPRRSKNIRPKIYLIQQAGGRCITGNSSTHREVPIRSCRTYIWKPRPHVGPLWSPWGPGCPYYFLRLFGRHVYSRLPGTLTRQVLVPAVVSEAAGAVHLEELAQFMWIPIPEGPMEGRTDKGYF